MFLYNLQVAIKMHREHIKPDVNGGENRRDNIRNWQSNWHDHMIQNEEKQNKTKTTRRQLKRWATRISPNRKTNLVNSIISQFESLGHSDR
jgi:hypothetical protein